MALPATAARLLPVPANEPPYDGPDRPSPPAKRSPRQAPLPLTFVRREAGPNQPSAGAVVRDEQLADDLAELRPWRRTSRADLCDPRPWATRLSRSIAEVISGARSPRQLAAWFTEDALSVLIGSTRRRRSAERYVAGSRGSYPRILVRSVRTCEPADGACEISVHLRIGNRSRAVAMRAEGRDGRWICTELVLG